MFAASWTTPLGALVFACVAATSAHGADFAGSNTGAIPDDSPAGRDVTFVVNGMSGPLADVRVAMALSHTYVRDVHVTLISPGGVARRFVFGGTGQNASGGTSDLDGEYVFHDGAANDWWAAAAAGALPSGEYRASTVGVAGTGVRTGGCASLLTFAFRELNAAQINGTWTLNVSDRIGGDVGTVSMATLSLLDADEPIFGNGFDRPVRGECVRAQFDYSGSNRTSYLVVRNTGGGQGGAVTWYVRDNDGTGTGFEREIALGTSNDTFVGGDFDGDGIWDPTVWTSGSPGVFRIKRSGQPADAPLLDIAFGQTNDDPTQAGDYDGDGIHDLAVHRAGESSGDPSFTLIRLSSTGLTRVLATGQHGQFAAGGADMTGDGIADVAMQRSAGSDVAEFNVHSGVNGAGVSTFNHGRPSDLIVTGNHAGDARADVMLVRGSGGNLVWSVRDAAGSLAPDVVFGMSATDFPLSGDFDGDGRDDSAVWRPSTTPGASQFMVRPSTTPMSPFNVPMGRQGDYPVANSRTH